MKLFFSIVFSAAILLTSTAAAAEKEAAEFTVESDSDFADQDEAVNSDTLVFPTDKELVYSSFFSSNNNATSTETTVDENDAPPVPQETVYNDIPLLYRANITDLESNDSRDNLQEMLTNYDSECYLSFVHFLQLKRTKDDDDAATAAPELPDCFFDMIQDRIAEFTQPLVAETGEAIVVTNQAITDILTAAPGEMKVTMPLDHKKGRKTRRDLYSKFRPAASVEYSKKMASGGHQRRAQPVTGHIDFSNVSTTDRNTSTEVALRGASSVGARNCNGVGEADGCLGAIINLIVETINVILCIFQFPSIGRLVGKSVSRKMGSDAKNEVKELIAKMYDADEVDQVEAIGSIFLLSVRSIGFTAFMESIFDNTEWYEWAVVSAILAIQLAAAIASGGASIAVAVGIKLLNLGAFGIALNSYTEECNGVGRIGCYSFPGFDFYEGKTMRAGWPYIGTDCFDDIVEELCVNQEGCVAVSTTRWFWFGVQPYDEWVPLEGTCKGILVRSNHDICKNDLDGYTFHNLFDSPGNTISSQPEKTLDELADECTALGSACQGFNAQGELKSVIKTTPYWTRPINTCQGLYTKNSVNVCPSAPGYTFYVGRDSPESNNLAVLQEKGGFIGDMLAACDARGEECQGFSTFGALKSSTISPVHEWTPTDLLCYGVYYRDSVPIDCGSLPGYLFFPNVEQLWNDITVMKLATNYELAAACDADPTCEGFNTDFHLKFKIQDSSFWVNRPAVQGKCNGLFVKENVYNPPPAFCETTRSEIDTRYTKTFTCRQPRFGKLHFYYQTYDVSDRGFDDDEYRIIVYEDNNEVYNSNKRYNQGWGSSGHLGTFGSNDMTTIFKVVFDCELSNPFSKCEGGDFSFKLVDCGCPDGATPLLECAIDSISKSRNAFCPATAPPTRSPTAAPTTLSPSPNPTRFPTQPPTPSPTSPPAPAVSGCFSGNMKASVEHVGERSMSELQLGDRVMTHNGVFEEIYAFGHRSKDEPLEFVRIFASGLADALELSEDHLLFVQKESGGSQVVRASVVKAGDELLLNGTTASSSWHNASTVVYYVDRIVRSGFFAPFTKSGVITVNGALASQYVTAQPSFNSLHFGQVDTGISWHWLVHTFQAGPRLYHRLFVRSSSPVEDTCTYAAEEFAGEYMRWFNKYRWVTTDQESSLVQYVMFPVLMLPLVAMTSSIYGLELLLDSLSVPDFLAEVVERTWSEA